MDVHGYMCSKPVWSTGCGTNDPLITVSESLTLLQWHPSGFKTYYWLWYSITASQTLNTVLPYQSHQLFNLHQRSVSISKLLGKSFFKKQNKNKSQGNYNVWNNLRLHHHLLFIWRTAIILILREQAFLHNTSRSSGMAKKIKIKQNKNHTNYFTLSPFK